MKVNCPLCGKEQEARVSMSTKNGKPIEVYHSPLCDCQASVEARASSKRLNGQ